MNNYYPLNINKNRVIGMQMMLRHIGKISGNELLFIPITGIFDIATENALNEYKSINGMPTDGEYNYETWYALENEYRNSFNEEVGVLPFGNTNNIIMHGENSDTVMLAQIMLNSICVNFDNNSIHVDGIYGSETENAVLSFQSICMLNKTGNIDYETWNKLTEEYNLTIGL